MSGGLLSGLADDGGLYVPARYPQVSPEELERWRALSYAELATEIVALYADDIPRAPRSLRETTAIFKESAVARDWLGDTFVEHFALTREWEWRQWQDAVTDWELKRYFEII